MLHSGVFLSKLIDLLLYVASDGTNDPNNNPAKKETILCVLFPCNTTTTPEVTTSSAAAAGNSTSTAGEMANISAHGNTSPSSYVGEETMSIMSVMSLNCSSYMGGWWIVLSITNQSRSLDYDRW